MTLIRYTLVVVAIYGFANVVNARSIDIDCKKQLIRSDRCVQSAVMFGNQSIPIARVPSDMEFYCPNAKSNLKCVSEIRKCLNPFPRTIFNIALKALRKNINAFCKPGSDEQLELLRQLTCFDQNDFQHLYNNVYKVTRIINEISTKSKADDIIPHLCCVHEAFGKAIVDDVDRKCVARIGSKTGTYFQNIAMGDFLEESNIGCGKFQEIEHCSKTFPQFMDSLAANQASSSKTNYTVLVPLIKLLERLDSEFNI